MKMAISIWCAALLSLFAVRAGAQLDSNAVVSIYCGDVSLGCTMTVTVRLFDTGTGSTYDVYRSLSTEYKGFHRLTGPDTYPWGMGLEVDTIAKVIRDFNIIKRSTYTDQHNGYGEDDLSITFGNLPYIDSLGTLLVNGHFEASYQFSTILGGGGKYAESGNCGSSGDTSDSVSIKITPSSLVVNPTKNSVTAEIFASVVNNFITFNFSNESHAMEMRIYNVVGRELYQQSVAPGVREIEIDPNYFPPGSYFARLGDAVAKFIVPPR